MVQNFSTGDKNQIFIFKFGYFLFTRLIVWDVFDFKKRKKFKNISPTSNGKPSKFELLMTLLHKNGHLQKVMMHKRAHENSCLGAKLGF